jgi:hypothetical protein
MATRWLFRRAACDLQLVILGDGHQAIHVGRLIGAGRDLPISSTALSKPAGEVITTSLASRLPGFQKV